MTGTDICAPLLRGYEPHAVVTWYDGKPMSAQDFCGVAVAMSARLPQVRHAVNLCERSPCFLLASAAAWQAGQTLLLPSDRVAHTLDRLRGEFPDAYCVCDTPGVARFARSRGFPVVEIDDVQTAGACWPPPQLALSLVAAYLHTSGSTGEPSRHAKSWGELVAGSDTFLRAFGSPGPAAAILGTVAPQHMFGFETTIMLVLQSGTPLLPTQPVFPADLGNALRTARALNRDGIWLLTTPLQLQAFKTGQAPVVLERVITSTMPLAPALAEAIERDWRVSVDEIYGCTEGGMLAHRRPAVSATFSAGAGIEFVANPDSRDFAQGGHLPAPLPLADRIEIVAKATANVAQQFRLLGRDDDVVKIAGKRASIAGLTHVLRSLPGVQDGVFFLPTPTAGRVAAAVVAPGMNPVQLRQALATLIDPAFHPRPLLLLDHLPRSVGMKIAIAALREMATKPRIKRGTSHVTASSLFEANISVTPDHPAFAGHFPGNPIVPGVVLLQQVEAALAGRGFVLRELTVVKFHATVGPSEAIAIRIELLDATSARFDLTRDGNPVASGRCRCEAMRSA